MASNPTKMEPDAPASPRATVLKIGKANALALVSALDPPENQPKQIKTWVAQKPSRYKFDVLTATAAFTFAKADISPRGKRTRGRGTRSRSRTGTAACPS